jgi:hypothetical protein
VITNIHNHRYLLLALESGVYAKNSGPGAETTFVFILDDSLNIIRNLKFPDASISELRQFENEEGFRFGLTTADNAIEIFREGIYEIDRDFRFRRIRDFVPSIGPNDIRTLNEFEYLHRLNNNPQGIFYSVADYGLNYLLKLSGDRTSIASSVLTSRNFVSDIFAYHPLRDKVYLFRLNYEQHGKFPEYDKDYGENWIEPHVLIYNPSNFELVDSLPVADFTSGNYPLAEKGQADVVGDFIVYYFFDDEWLGRFNPAMLFIFDTRTNEATWLRVGWR